MSSMVLMETEIYKVYLTYRREKSYTTITIGKKQQHESNRLPYFFSTISTPLSSILITNPLAPSEFPLPTLHPSHALPLLTPHLSPSASSTLIPAATFLPSTFLSAIRTSLTSLGQPIGSAGRRYFALVDRLLVITAQSSIFDRLSRWKHSVADADAGVDVKGILGRKASASSTMMEWMVRCELACAVGLNR